MTVFVYVDTSKQLGDPEHIKVFATTGAAETWFEDNDPETWVERRIIGSSSIGRLLDSEIVDPLTGAHLCDQPARLLAASGPSL